MSSINYLNFCGTESAGSVAKRKNKSEQTPPNTNVASNYYLRNDLESGDKVCFRGNDAYDGKKKKKSIALGIASTILLAGGAKGKRYALPNAEIMIHQPLGGTKGQATEIEIAARHILKTKDKLNRMLAENTGKDFETVAADTERDNWKTAQEALEYGLIDKVITSRTEN